MGKLTVEQELQKATGVKPKAKEKEQDYLKRLHNAASELDDDGWKGLSTPAQKWCNAATKAFDADEDIPGFDDGDDDVASAPKKKGAKAAAEDEDDDTGADDDAGDETEGDDADEADAEDSEDEDVKPTKKGAKAAPAKSAKKPAKEEPAPKKKSTTKKAGPGPKVGVIDALKEVLEGGKALTVAQILAKLQKKFPDRGHGMINTIRTQLSVLPTKGYKITKTKTDDGVTYQKGGKK